jgi:hypothetical protein
MVSLGQLTAGIANEIKNPLNFVNNFSDLSIDLLNELRDAVAPDKLTIAADLRAEIDDLTATLHKGKSRQDRPAWPPRGQHRQERAAAFPRGPAALALHGMRAGKCTVISLRPVTIRFYCRRPLIRLRFGIGVRIVTPRPSRFAPSALAAMTGVSTCRCIEA